ncbi:MAG: TetR/AcrR family transcriptional regulator [Firmicutes bacterium]|nr:TetR/AcrR family transcriptional regulator [Bacillota bacterium]
MVQIKKPDPKQRIIETAATLFAERGFEAVPVREIADRAQVNVAMINYYFRNKNGLYHAIIEKLMGELNERLESEVAEGADPVDRLKRYVYSYVSYLRQESQTAQLVFQAIFLKDTDLDYLVERYWVRTYAMVEQVLREGVAAGVFSPIDSRLIPISIRGMLLWYFMSSPITVRLPGMREYRGEFDEKLAEETLHLLLQGLLKR